MVFISYIVSVPLRRDYRGSRISVFVCSFAPVSFCIFDYLYWGFWFFVVWFVTPATLLKKETLAQVFSCEFCEISKNTFYYRTPLVSDHPKNKEGFLLLPVKTKRNLLNVRKNQKQQYLMRKTKLHIGNVVYILMTQLWLVDVVINFAKPYFW